jgi:hypothetical protein
VCEVIFILKLIARFWNHGKSVVRVELEAVHHLLATVLWEKTKQN